MCPIVHLSLKVDDVQQAGDFYAKVFGFRDTETKRTRDHVSRHMTDGTLDFTLMQYDAGTESAESKAAGAGPCIHHFAVEVPDVTRSAEQIWAKGCELISEPGVLPVKFRATGGTVAELVPVGRYQKPVISGKVCPIVHISLQVDDVQASGDFYRDVFGFQDAIIEQKRRHLARHMTDGRIDVALFQPATEARGELKAQETAPRIHHFAVEVEDVEAATVRVQSHGCKIISAPGVLPVKFLAPGGTFAELVPIGRYQRRPLSRPVSAGL